MIPDTATRVLQHTPTHINERIAEQTHERIAAFQGEDRHAIITQRLRDLDAQWDTERILQTNFAVFSLIGLALGTKVDKRWFALALGVPAFMVQHALQGRCPPLSVLRQLGVRTSREINEERFALKCLRGDFKKFGESPDPAALAHAVKS
jgi:hypothetical protein